MGVTLGAHQNRCSAHISRATGNGSRASDPLQSYSDSQIGGVMAEEQVYSQGVIDALVESNEFLQEEVSRLRNNNRMLRTVISAQRKTATVLRDQVAIAAANDEAFKEMCSDAPVENVQASGLLDS